MNYIHTWQSNALSPDGRIVQYYGDVSTWSLTYNLYANTLLGLDLLNQTVRKRLLTWQSLGSPSTLQVFDRLSAYYASLLQSDAGM